ncbi:PREDICTED: U-box domain-containing protein 5 isoform X2 [Tarenaya hassleriana]|nr:PREDICTED: U-box domain-containing protein 5 isoform X2 [Tarenaya hassleriana]XP_010548325.1 PREDICTED: U-box domain-containing protein 5 isoform X2 [Tarenaya hassleriana]
MRNDIIAEGLEALPRSFKMHSSMCMKLRNLVVRIMRIFPDIEEARPRCLSGIQTLCLLNNALEKSKLLLQYCSESSKLYMAVTGDAILSRSLRAKNLLEQSLSEIQNMVPVVLAVKISEIIHDLRCGMFSLDPSEEDAGKAIAEMMRRRVSSSVSSDDIKDFHFAAGKLQLSTPKAIVIERRSLKVLLQKVGEDNLHKRKILRYLLYLLHNLEQFITRDQKEDSHEELCSAKCSVSGNDSQVEFSEEHKHRDHESCLLVSATPPEEFICPLSLRIMYDPVIISSGQTFERVWIQKWFDEGNDSCPKTKTKLDNLLLYPDTRMKDLISRWCSKYGVNVEDPGKQSEAFRRMDFSSISIASFGSSMYNLRLPSDISSISIGGSDASFSGETPPISKISKGSAFTGHMGSSHSEVEIEIDPLCGLDDLAWEAQRKVVKDVRNRLEHNSRAFPAMSPPKFLKPLVSYLKNANNIHCVEDIRAGLDLLLTFLTKNRKAIESLNEDAFRLLSLFLDSEVAGEALNIVEVLSGHPHGLSKIAFSGFVSSLLKIFESQAMDLQEQAMITLQNLSSSNEICLEMVSLQFIQKLASFLQHNMLRKHSVIILRNLCDIEKGRASVVKTAGCLASVAELLESDSHDEQENAVSILLMLCMQPDYCYLVMDEGINVIPSLVFISNNGNDRAKASASELLRVLRDVDFGKGQGSSAPEEPAVQHQQHVTNSVSQIPTPSPKKSGLFGFKLSVPVLKKKR